MNLLGCVCAQHINVAIIGGKVLELGAWNELNWIEERVEIM